MRAGVGYSESPDSVTAGRQAAEAAVKMSGRTDLCDLVLLFCTARHDQKKLRGAVAEVAGASVPIYGGGAAGIITNTAYGYAGDQVGVACLWLDGVTCDVLTDKGLLDGEEGSGFRLGQGLARLGVTSDSPVMLFYEAVSRNDDTGISLIMATGILQGLEKALGFLPNLTGAGFMGDHVCSPTSQYTGTEVDEHCAMAFTFGGDIHIDNVIMHGCIPASEYYTVTKADGQTILEINHQPALTFINERLQSYIEPERYPFFLIFGINSGERWGEYEEDKYASRLCLGIDKERGGIIMFEPDMTEGTEFRLMFRSFDLDYMRPKFELPFTQLNGRKPVFAIYIDCAGRCAGYGGADIEDALLLQQVVGDRVPVLGIYTGVEIASVAGRPRGLDWTGVFCLFSQGEKNSDTISSPNNAEYKTARRPFDQNPPLEAIRTLCEQNAARALLLDTQLFSLRHELELKRRGFSLLSELAVSIRQTSDYMIMFVQVARRMNAVLNMQKTIVLLSDGTGTFAPVVLQGFTSDEQIILSKQHIKMPEELMSPHPVIVTAEDPSGRLQWLREKYALPFFIASPILLQGEMTALLITGRMREQPPFLTRLGTNDLETVQSITELLGSMLLRLRLHDVTRKAETDGLTGLWNRGAFRQMVEEYLRVSAGKSGAFMMLDVDHFKTVNDTYGHISGDELLKSCAAAMQSVLRESDIIGRQGGDEFVVYCRTIKDKEQAEKKAQQIADSWENVIPNGGTKHITASIGIALSPQHGASFEELYNNADAALYKAKERGRNCYVLFESE